MNNDLIKYYFFIFFSLVFFSCRTSDKQNIEALYLSDIDQKFNRINTIKVNGNIEFTYYPDNYNKVDTIKFKLSSGRVLFEHHAGDISIKKHKSFLTQLDYYDYEWFKNDSNWVSCFQEYESRINEKDSLKIVLVYS